MDTTTLGTLYLIPVSLGESIHERYQPPYNIELLTRLKTIVAENAKTARRYIKSLCPEVVLSEVEVLQIDKHNGYAFPTPALEALQQGKDVGLMSEAGCPAVADPGSDLVRKAHELGVKVVPLVGPSSILLSLMASGMSGQHFSFCGYLPIDQTERKQALEQMLKGVRRGQTQLFIETPYRSQKLLEYLLATLPSEVYLSVATNLTTPTERIISQPIHQWRRMKLPELHKCPSIFLIGR